MSGPRGAAYWDARYADEDRSLFGDAPNQFLRMVLSRPEIAPSSALMIADGDGRNGRWLAARRIAVTAFDLSAVATRQALARDEAAGAQVERTAADLREWRPDPDRRFDLCAILYLHGPPDLRRAAASLAADMLAPGGLLLIECFAVEGALPGAPGPETPIHRWTPEELRDWLPELEIAELMQGEVSLDEGRRHAGAAAVLRLLARRPV